jgi:hypothetical protein
MAGTAVSFELTGLDSLRRMQTFLAPDLLEKASKGGMSYAGKAAVTTAAKEVRSHYNIPSARVKQDITGPRISQGGQVATLVFSRKPPSALSYGGKDTGKGLRMKIARGGSLQPVTRGFIAKTGKLAGLPFRRVSSQSGSRLAFVSGPSIGSLFLRQGDQASVMQAAVQARINEQFLKGFDRVVKAAARGYGGR